MADYRTFFYRSPAIKSPAIGLKKVQSPDFFMAGGRVFFLTVTGLFLAGYRTFFYRSPAIKRVARFLTSGLTLTLTLTLTGTLTLTITLTLTLTPTPTLTLTLTLNLTLTLTLTLTQLTLLLYSHVSSPRPHKKSDGRIFLKLVAGLFYGRFSYRTFLYRSPAIKRDLKPTFLWPVIGSFFDRSPRTFYGR